MIEQKPIQIRAPQAIIDQIDALIESGEFPSRREFFKRVAIEYLSARPERLLDWLKAPEVQNEICRIVSTGLMGVGKHE